MVQSFLKFFSRLINSCHVSSSIIHLTLKFLLCFIWPGFYSTGSLLRSLPSAYYPPWILWVSASCHYHTWDSCLWFEAVWYIPSLLLTSCSVLRRVLPALVFGMPVSLLATWVCIYEGTSSRPLCKCLMTPTSLFIKVLVMNCLKVAVFLQQTSCVRLWVIFLYMLSVLQQIHSGVWFSTEPRCFNNNMNFKKWWMV